MSDAEFDSLLDQLRALNPNSWALRVAYGYSPANAPLEKYAHRVEVGSLGKIRSLDQLQLTGEIVATPKLDGGSAVAYYVDGRLERVLSRGDGTIGLDITQNMLYGGTIPTRLISTESRGILAVRGEILISLEDFGHMDGTSPRNKAVGLSQSLRSNPQELARLQFVAYDIPLRKSPPDGYESIKKDQDLHLLERRGFRVVPWVVCPDRESIAHEIGDIARNPIVTETQYGSFQIDGVVLSQRQPQLVRTEIGFEVVYPSIAYKFEDASAWTTVRGIRWDMTRTGRHVPVALVEPVDLAGATISRVTLNNPMWMREVGVDTGAKVRIVRSNMIIPMVVEVADPVSEPVFPTRCKLCNQPLIWHGRDIVCANPDCERNLDLLTRMWPFILVDGIGITLIEHLCSTFGIVGIEDFEVFCDTVTPAMLTQKYGPRTSEKFMRIVEHARAFTVNPGIVLLIANIPMVGDATAELFATKVPAQEFWDVYEHNLPEPESWAVRMNRTAWKNFQESRVKIQRLLKYFGRSRIVDFAPEGSLAPRLHIAMTGALSRPRQEILTEFARYGIVEASPATADVLIAAGPSHSNKYQTALRRQIPILTETEFRTLYKFGGQQ
jgi:DNA ligase (NAD+)